VEEILGVRVEGGLGGAPFSVCSSLLFHLCLLWLLGLVEVRGMVLWGVRVDDLRCSCLVVNFRLNKLFSSPLMMGDSWYMEELNWIWL